MCTYGAHTFRFFHVPLYSTLDALAAAVTKALSKAGQYSAAGPRHASQQVAEAEDRSDSSCGGCC
eukprot:COSAG01_NODE_5828_length_4007_cov_15.721597_6_plen_65_part_00